MGTANRWPTAEAKAKFAEMTDRADKCGPQIILKNGKPKFVVMAFEEFQKKTKPEQSFAEFLINSPLRGMKFERLKGKVRPVKF